MRTFASVVRLVLLASAATMPGAVFSSMSAFAAVAISSATTQHMNCANGLCIPTAKDAVLNAGDLAAMLAGGNVEVSTGSGSLAAKVEDIDVAAGFNWSNANSLTLDAYRSIAFHTGSVVVNGSGAVTFVTNDGGSAGTLSFQPGASLSFAATNNILTINGAPFALENSIATLASAIAANPSGSFALASNYDAIGDGHYKGSPINTNLSGSVEGLGNTISNLSIFSHPTPGRGKDSWTNVGLFSEVVSPGRISDLAISHLKYDVPAWGADVGGLVGTNGGGILFNDYASGSVRAGTVAGGLVGDNFGTIISSHASVEITGDSMDAGGLAGESGEPIELSSAQGAVEGATAGGLVGQNSGPISESFATGRVTCPVEGEVGGLVGEQLSAEIQNSYATGGAKCSQTAQVGGLIGSNTFGSQYYSYSTGFVSGYPYVGGFIGSDEAPGTVSSYWDTTTSKTDQGEYDDRDPPGLVGLTSKELRSGLPSGFDPAIWREKKGVNRGFPYLINNPPPKD